MKAYHIGYTSNDGVGRYCYQLYDDKHNCLKEVYSDSLWGKTANQVLLKAVIDILENDENVFIYTNNEYVVKILNEQSKPTLNKELVYTALNLVKEKNAVVMYKMIGLQQRAMQNNARFVNRHNRMEQK